MRCRWWLAPLLLGAVVLPSGWAAASVLWDGSASKGVGVFVGVECTQGTVSAVQDPTYGAVWKIFFPDGDTRCEVKGSTGYEFKNDGKEVYVSWRSRYDVADGTLRYVFQMKGYPDASHPLRANHPIVFGTEHNSLVLINYDLADKRHDVWKADITRTEWVSIALRMKMSDDPNVGFIELWFNGVKQTLTGGTDRYPANTFDAAQTRIKWGIYRSGQGPGDCTQYLATPKIGTTYEDVALGGSPGSAIDASAPPDASGRDAAVALSPDAAGGEPDGGERPDATVIGGSPDSRRPVSVGLDGNSDPGGAGTDEEPPPKPAGKGSGCAFGAHGPERSVVGIWAVLASLFVVGRRRRRGQAPPQWPGSVCAGREDVKR
jgi:hypothetical protein